MKRASFSLVVVCGCQSANSAPYIPPPSSIPDAAPDVSINTTPDAGPIVGIQVEPLALSPAFSPAITDYTVRCGSTPTNALVVIRFADGSTETQSMQLGANELVNVDDQYFVRCLPADFPVVTVTTADAGAGPTPGYYLLNSISYGMVFDGHGVPVWYARYDANSEVVDVDSPALNTISLLPNGIANDPFGYVTSDHFELRALDTHQTTVVAANGVATDFHELQTLPNGDHLVFAYPIEEDWDLTGLASYGEDEVIADCEVQEVDPAGNLVWSWLASDHVDPVQESLTPQTDTVGSQTVVDVFHCNSIDADASGNLLVSMRHTSAVFYIDRSTGDVLWKLGGTPYNQDGATLIAVTGDPESTFSMQHDARFQANGDVSLFDDHGTGPGVARGVEYTIDHVANTATVAFQHLGTAASQFEGSFRRYTDGESVIGWGHIPTDPRVMTEIDSAGREVFSLAFSGTNPSYRAIKVPLTQLDIQVLRSSAAQ